MADALTLSYADQRDAVQERRFPSSTAATYIPQWLAAAYADVWNAEEWTFKRVTRATWYTTADGTSTGTATATPEMPSDFARPRFLYDDQGNELRWLDEREFDSRYAGDASTGRPSAYKTVNRQITLWPTPVAKYAFTLSYKRRLSTRTAGGTVQVGFYQADTDIPLWDDHNYILVVRAKIIGLRDRSDPTSADLVDEYQRLLAAMVEEYAEETPMEAQLPAWRP